jgi:adenosylmethionine---8-amino-7-oxononanoate aminotransferase
MSDVVILGTDTGAGKTTFALLWLTAFTDDYEYWKPLETGESDTAAVKRLVPAATAHPPLRSFARPVAPLLAAGAEGIPASWEIAAGKPRPTAANRHLVVETFGSPFSPLNELELQIKLIALLDMPCVLVTSSAVGAVGRALQCAEALARHRIEPAAVVLLGEKDSFAEEHIRWHWDGEVLSVPAPVAWESGSVAAAAQLGREPLHQLRALLPHLPAAPDPSPLQPLSAAATLWRDRHSVWHPYTSLGDDEPPLVCVGAQDEFLYLADGRRVVDAISSWWTILHGHRHPVLLDALERASQTIDHVHFAGITHRPAVELAELMLQTTPWPAGRVFFSDNGSTAVEVALKMAYQFWCHQGEPERTRFVGFEGGYHGDTFGAMAVGRDPVFFGRFERLLLEASIVPLSANALDAELSRQRGRVAAVILEPLVQGAGGMRMHTP